MSTSPSTFNSASAGPSRPYAQTSALPQHRDPLPVDEPPPIPRFLSLILKSHRPPIPPTSPLQPSVSALSSGNGGASGPGTSNGPGPPSPTGLAEAPPSSASMSKSSSGSTAPGTGVGGGAVPGVGVGGRAGTSASGRPAPQPLYLPPPAMPDIEEDLVPPENFAVVTSGVYRSGFPKKRNFRFLETLRLKTILTLVLEDYPEANLKWCQSQDVQFMQFGIPGNKEPFDNIPEDVISSALCAILDRRNHPLLIHCNKGKHRTGCLVGCIRRVQSWSLTSIFDEYRRFSNPKSRAVDQQFIDLFDLGPVWDEVVSAKGGGLENLPQWEMLTVPRSRVRATVRAGAGAGAGKAEGEGVELGVNSRARRKGASDSDTARGSSGVIDTAADAEAAGADDGGKQGREAVGGDSGLDEVRVVENARSHTDSGLVNGDDFAVSAG